MSEPSCLVQLSHSLQACAAGGQQQLSTHGFTAVCEAILPFFDHLGPVFAVARGEFEGKLTSLKQLIVSHPQLTDIIDEDRQADRATVKNSPTRNLHRLAAAILFVKLLFQRLVEEAAAAAAAAAAGDAAGDAAGEPQPQPPVTLREAAGAAYEGSLAPFHTAIVRGIVRAGMLTLPSREHFLQAIGESEASAAQRAYEVVDACAALHAAVSRLFEGIAMPASDVWWWPSA